MGLLLTYTIIYYGCELGVIILYLLIYALEFNFYLVCTWNSQNWLTNTVTMCIKSHLVCWFLKNRIISFSCESEVYTAYHD